MAAKPISIYPTDKQRKKLAKYLESHGVDSATAGRIAVDRLLKSPPTKSEIEKATVKRSVANLKQFQKQKDDQ